MAGEAGEEIEGAGGKGVCVPIFIWKRLVLS